MVILVCDPAGALHASKIEATSHSAPLVDMSYVLLVGLWGSGRRRVLAGEGVDAPAEQAVGGEAEQPERDQRHEDLVDQHEQPAVPEHLAQAVVGGDQL